MDNAFSNKRTGNIKYLQLETLVSFMEKNSILAVGKKEYISNEKRKAMWMDLQNQLNGVAGGIQKTVEQWKKTWNDQKAKTHAKAMKLIESGGNSTHLTPLEERILKILSLNNEFKSPEPSSDIFLIPETGIVFSLPIVTQDGNQTTELNTPSTSQAAPNTFLVSPETHDPLMSESSTMSVAEVLSSVAVTAKEVTLIKQETEEKRNLITETTKSVTVYSREIAKPVTNYSAKISESVNNSSLNEKGPAEIERSSNNYPSSTTLCNIAKANFQKGRRRRTDHRRSHYMTADKAAETFRFISERNCAVMERIASAIETQAARAAKQTQLLREIIDVVKRR